MGNVLKRRLLKRKIKTPYFYSRENE